MKRFWLVVLAMGLAMTFAMPAFAVDVKFTGTWYMAGFYSDNHSLLDKSSVASTDGSWNTGALQANRGAAAYYTHKLRLQTIFQITEGLKLTTSIDALESLMGDNSWSGGSPGRASQPTSTRTSQGAAGHATQENVEFEMCWVDFKLPVGQVSAGYMNEGAMIGTLFLNHPYTYPGIKYFTTAGPVSVFAEVRKIREWRQVDNYATGSSLNNVKNDADSDVYQLGGIFKFSAGEVGLVYEFWRESRAKSAGALGTDGTALVPAGSNGWVGQLSTINPWVKAQFGPVYVEAEGYYRFGNLRKYETFNSGVTQEPDASVSAYGAYINGRVDFKPVFVGAMFIYMSGDDMQNKDKVTGNLAMWYGDNYVSPTGTLVLWNYEYLDAMGPMYGNIPAGAANGGANPRTNSNYQNTRHIDNLWFVQLYAGVNPTAKSNITAKLSYATADKKPKMGIGNVGDVLTASTTAMAAGTVNREFVSDKIGTEIDLIASYKIYDNLTYTVGAGYLFTGEYFKGYDINNNAKVKDNYILTHKLSLFF